MEDGHLAQETEQPRGMGGQDSSSTYSSAVNWESLAKASSETNLRNLRDDLEKNPTTFLLNNIALSVQFFKNFERDKDDVQKAKEAQKNYFDMRLSQLKKNCIIPPTVLSKVHEYVTYKNDVGQFEPLLTDEYIICYNNIEVDRSENFERLEDGSIQYCNLDDHTYRVCIEDGDLAKHQGYVRVRCVDNYSRLESRSSLGTLADSDNRKVEKYLESLSPVPHPGSFLAPPPSTDPSHKLPSPSMKKLAFKDVIEEGSEEEEEEDGADSLNEDVKNLRKILGDDNYLKKPVFGPSENELRKNVTLDTYIGYMYMQSKLQERRPSGVLPLSYQKLSKKDEEFKKRIQEKRLETIGAGESSSRPTQDIKTKPPPPRITEGSSGEKEDNPYGYVSVKKVPLSSYTEERSSARGSLIPETCFEDKDVQIVENSETDPYPINAETERRRYLSSKGMMTYFESQFPSICDKLEKEAFKDPDNTEVRQPDVYCNEFEDRKMNIWKFTPSIECGFWPDQGFEWLLRSRCVMRDKRTGVEYQWPSKEHIAAAQQLGFNIVPRGFVFPRVNTVNPDTSIEWEVRFSKAELFITRNLHHPKLRVYLLATVLYKAYFEMFDGIKKAHFRYIMYWLIERSPGDWTEENVGEKLLLLLNYLKKHLTKQKMPHYFLSKCNMFANIANHKIQAAAERVYRILEKPVLHVLQAVDNLHYEKNFYPKLDAKRLYKILTEEAQSQLAQTLGGGFEEQIYSNLEQVNKETKPGRDKYQEKMRKERKKLEEEKVEREARKSQKTVIDVKADLKPMNEIRKRILLEFFIDHFIKMAERSNIHRTHGQGFLYVQHSENLLTLLSELGYDNTTQYNKLNENIYRLKQNHTVMSVKDYWNISYGHPKLFHSSSFRSTEQPTLPSLPSPEASPIPGIERNGDILPERAVVEAEVHARSSLMAHAHSFSEAHARQTSEDKSVWDRLDLGYNPDETDDFEFEDTKL